MIPSSRLHHWLPHIPGTHTLRMWFLASTHRFFLSLIMTARYKYVNIGAYYIWGLAPLPLFTELPLR